MIATAPPITPAPITANGTQMRAALDAATAPQASIQRAFADITATLSRAHGHWMLTLLSDDGPIPQASADLWAAAVGAPSVEWWRTRQGRRVTCDWTEAGR